VWGFNCPIHHGETQSVATDADFQESDHRFYLKSINNFSLGDHHRSAATLACSILRRRDRFRQAESLSSIGA